jgi:hypothetical protein
VHLQLHFTIGPGRNWLHLWKPTIDALGENPRPWPERTRLGSLGGRIVAHRRPWPAPPRRSRPGNDVTITIAARQMRR